MGGARQHHRHREHITLTTSNTAAAAGRGAGALERLPAGTVAAYGMPAVGAGYMYLLVGLYVMKFSTDVLLISPLVMGLIFSASRVWDAVSDPLVGYLSDRTRSRFGRRRTWMAASVVPIGALFVMIFAPPPTLTGASLIAWMAVAVIGFYSVMTVFFVPHLSLGAELSTNYHERSRLFGYRHGFFTFGYISSLVTMQLLIGFEAEGGETVRHWALLLSIPACVGMAALVLFAVAKLRERPEFQGRVGTSPLRAFADVWRNEHSRLLIIVTLIENIGSAAIGALTLYVTQYVVGAPHMGPAVILAYMIPSAFSVPLWIPLSRRIGKVRLWMYSMIGTGLSFGGMFALPFLPPEWRLGTMFVFAALAGLAAGCGGTVGPSVQGDVIDYDEHLTGERKEGSYFAAWNFVYKSAVGIMLALTGFVLDFSGFVPNQPQALSTQVWIVGLYGLFPLICYAIGAALFSRFKLNEAAYAEIRRKLDGGEGGPESSAGG